MPYQDAFSEVSARSVLTASGEDGDAAELLALGENAVFTLPDGGPVVRVGRASADLAARAEHELRIAVWLETCGIPAVRPAADTVELIDGHPVTRWQRLPDAVRKAEPADLAGLLRQVHELGAAPFPLGRRELLGGVERWLRLAGHAIPPEDAAYLRSRRDDFADAVTALEPVLPPGTIHGDALPRNVHVGPDGPVLVDLETFSDDMREHDLVVMALSHDRYGISDVAYSGFTRTYGWDVRQWDGCAVLRGARETASCAWVAQHAPGNPAARAEFGRRIASLRENDPSVRWYPF